MICGAALQDDEELPTPIQEAAQLEASSQGFLEQDDLTWGAAQDQHAGSPLLFTNPTTMSMDVTIGSLEGFAYRGHHESQEDLGQLLDADTLDTTESAGAREQPSPGLYPNMAPICCAQVCDGERTSCGATARRLTLMGCCMLARHADKAQALPGTGSPLH